MGTSSWSLEQNYLQKKVEEAMASEEFIRTPPDMRSFVEGTARLVAKKGLEFEKSLMKKYPRLNLNFLRSSEDPFHGYYQQKLSQFLSQNHREEDGVVASTGIIEPPPDMRTMIVRTARIVAQNGLEFENMDHPKDAKLCFLSSSDPFHGFYQQKLSQFLSQINREEDGVVASTEIIEPPPGIIRNIIESAALYLSKKGLQAERLMMARNAYNPKYSFMKRSDPFHAFYRHKLSEYRSHHNQQEDGANHDTAADSHDDGHEGFYLDQPQTIVLPDLLQIRLPKGMNFKEFVTLKLTAQFAAWYGYPFFLPLMERAGFEFTNPNDSRFPRFSRFLVEYAKVLTPRKDLERKLLESDAYTAAIHDGFFRLLQWDSLQEFKWRHGGVKAMIDWHASLEKYFFANKVLDDEELPPPATGTSTHAPLPLHEEEPEPKRQKLDEPALVPEDQFLAQHPGSSTIRVSVANVDGGCLVIETTVESLSESVASLKEKIAGEIQIPADRQKLSGKAGFLEDNRSLAHYNVGPGENLTLSLSEDDVV